MVKTADFRVLKTLYDFVWNSGIERPNRLTQVCMEDLQFLEIKENPIFMGTMARLFFVGCQSNLRQGWRKWLGQSILYLYEPRKP